MLSRGKRRKRRSLPTSNLTSRIKEAKITNNSTDLGCSSTTTPPKLVLFCRDWPIHCQGFVLMSMFWMPDELDVVLLRGRAAYVSIAGCRPIPQSKDAGQTSVNRKKAFSLQDFLSSLAVLRARESNSATRPVPGILSRWWWTGGWTGRLGREWWLVPDYTSGGWVPFSSSSSSRHMLAMATKTGCFPVCVLQQGVKLFIRNMTWRDGRTGN